jgi:hypothetical protein
MKAYTRRSVYLLCALLILLSSRVVMSAESSSIVPNIPAGLVIEKDYEPGLGRALGSVRLVQGRVVIMHADMKKGYLAERDTPLYKGDIIVTQDAARVRFGLRDGSVVTLASNTRLELSESVFERKKKSRFSFLKLGLGKARFIVTKFIDFRRSNVRVKTPTAVVGVRGSDYVIEATLLDTEVTTFGDTSVEFVSDAYPEQIVTLGSFQNSKSTKDTPPSKPRNISPREADEKKKGLLFPPDMEELEDEIIREIEDKEPGRTAYDILLGKRKILIPKEELVEPEGKKDVSEPDDDLRRIMKENRDITEYQELIEQTLTEDAVDNLPTFPQSPY